MLVQRKVTVYLFYTELACENSALGLDTRIVNFAGWSAFRHLASLTIVDCLVLPADFVDVPGGTKDDNISRSSHIGFEGLVYHVPSILLSLVGRGL